MLHIKNNKSNENRLRGHPACGSLGAAFDQEPLLILSFSTVGQGMLLIIPNINLSFVFFPVRCNGTVECDPKPRNLTPKSNGFSKSLRCVSRPTEEILTAEIKQMDISEGRDLTNNS